MVSKDINQIIPIVNGNYSPPEASDLLNELIKSRINHLKIQMLRLWEGNHRVDTKDLDKQIEVILKEKTEAIALISKAKMEGSKVEIIGNIEVRVSKFN